MQHLGGTLLTNVRTALFLCVVFPVVPPVVDETVAATCAFLEATFLFVNPVDKAV